jgi:ATP-dependent Clp protease adaptor protein ClpS
MDSRLYLLNDDIHSFEEVVYVLKRYLGYSDLQGASIADLVHRNGKCEIRTGYFDELELLKEMLNNEGYKVRLENDYEGY